MYVINLLIHYVAVCWYLLVQSALLIVMNISTNISVKSKLLFPFTSMSRVLILSPGTVEYFHMNNWPASRSYLPVRFTMITSVLELNLLTILYVCVVYIRAAVIVCLQLSRKFVVEKRRPVPVVDAFDPVFEYTKSTSI